MTSDGTPTWPIVTLDLGQVRLPQSHPRAGDGQCPIHGFVIMHPDGSILVDTGVGFGNDLIEQLYEPASIPLIAALHANDIDERSISAIALTHLHFDHCGQHGVLARTPVHVQKAELEAATEPHYTVAEWATIDSSRLRSVDGDEEIAPGVTLLATPGHTPGHQSVLVGDELIVGQACYTCAEFESATVAEGDLHDATYRCAADESIARLRSMHPRRAHFSHDTEVFRS